MPSWFQLAMRQFFFAPPVNPTFKKKHSCLRGIFGETKIHLSDSWEAKASLTRADGWAIGDFIGKNSGNGPWISQRSWSRLVGSGSLWNVEKDEKIIEHNYHTCCIYYVYIYIYFNLHIDTSNVPGSSKRCCFLRYSKVCHIRTNHRKLKGLKV